MSVSARRTERLIRKAELAGYRLGVEGRPVGDAYVAGTAAREAYERGYVTGLKWRIWGDLT